MTQHNYRLDNNLISQIDGSSHGNYGGFSNVVSVYNTNGTIIIKLLPVY